MFSPVYLCLNLFTFVCHYLLVLFYVYLCLPLLTRFYLCLPLFTHIHLSLIVSNYVYYCLVMLLLPKFTRDYSCLLTFTLIQLFLPLLTCFELCLLVITYFYHCLVVFTQVKLFIRASLPIITDAYSCLYFTYIGPILLEITCLHLFTSVYCLF